MVERQRRRLGAALAMGLFSCVLGEAARAETPEPKDLASSTSETTPDGPRLEWRAPGACPTRDVVLSHVASLAAKDDVSWTRFQRLRATLEPEGAGWRLDLEFEGQGEVRRRVMRGGGCVELAEAAAVAIVLAHRTAEGATEEWDIAAPRATDLEGQPPVTSLASEAHSPSSEPRAADDVGGGTSPGHVGGATGVTLSAGAEAVLDPATLGSAAFGAAAGLTLRSGASSARLYAAGFPAVHTRLGTGQAISVGLWTGGLTGCHGWGRGLDTCALLELGQVSASGVGLTQAREGRDLWAAPGLSLAFTAAPFDGLGITTRLSAFHPLIRGRFRVDEGDVVHRIPFVGFRAAVGIDIPLL
jgi:hypothetical protein